LDPILWWSAVHDETQSSLDRDAIRSRESISAGLIDIVDEQMAKPVLDARFTDALRPPGFVRLAGFDADMNADAWADLLREAESLALDLLEIGSEQ